MLLGFMNSYVFNDISISVRPCNNLTDNNTCQSQEIITEMLDGNYFDAVYLSFQPDLNNYNNPLKVMPIYNYFPISLEISSVLDMFFGKAMVEIYTGVLQEDNTTFEGINFHSSQYNAYHNQDSFMKIYMALDPTIQVTSLKFDSILDVISKVGGLMRILTVLATLLLKPFISNAIPQRICKENFDYNEYFNEKKGEKNPKTIINSKNELSFWEYVKSKIKNTNYNAKSVLMIHCIKTVKKTLDVSLLINKLFDIEKLKLMFQNESEFFNQKPKITQNERHFDNINFRTEKEKQFHRGFCLNRDYYLGNNQFLRKTTLNKDQPPNQIFLNFKRNKKNKEFNDLDNRIKEESLEKVGTCSRVPEFFLLTREAVCRRSILYLIYQLGIKGKF